MIKLTEEQLKEKEAFIQQYIGNDENNASNSEVDPNANVTIKNVATLDTELNKPEDVQINRYILGNKIAEMFGKDEQRLFNQLLEDHFIYSHDESAILKPYCVAIDSSPLIHDGMITLGGDSNAPQHLASFCGEYVNMIYFIASEFAGAVADVVFLTLFHYFAKKDYGDNYLVTHTKEINDSFQHIVYTLNQPAASRGNQSVFYNTSIFDTDYYQSLFAHFIYPDGSSPKYSEVNKLQKYFMHWFNEERTKALLTFPVITASYLTVDRFAKDIDFKEFLASEMAEGNSFFHYTSDTVDSLSSCCRLKNNIDVNQFTYTLGGTGIMTGSKKVFTINVNRVMQIKGTVSSIAEHLRYYLIAYNELLYTMQKHYMLPVYDAHYISLDKQYLTIGLNGVIEAAEYLGYNTTNYNPEYINWLKQLLGELKKTNIEEAKKYTKSTGHKIMFNTELVPAENVGVKFAKWDKTAGYKVPRDCYNSYLYEVENPDTTILDKFRMHGKEIVDNFDGGSAVHINLKECPNKGTWLKIIDMSTKAGCSYWTYNVRETCCNDCGYNSKEDRISCPKCGSKNVTWATRIIGYLKKITSFSRDRQAEEKTRFRA